MSNLDRNEKFNWKKYIIYVCFTFESHLQTQMFKNLILFPLF